GRLRRRRFGIWWPRRTCRRARAAATHHHATLQNLGLVLRADPLEIAGRRMTRGASACAVERRLAGLRIADEDIENLVQVPSGDQANGVMQKRREVRHLGVGELIELRHAAIGPADAEEFAELPAAFVLLDERRAREIGAARSAARVRAVAEAALRAEQLAAPPDRCSIGDRLLSS